MKASGQVWAAWGKALYDLAQSAESVEEVDRDLAQAISLISGHSKLRETLADPKIPAKSKGAIVVEVFDGLSPLVVGAVVALGETGDQNTLPAVYEAYQRTSEEARQVSIADVTTAVPLSDALRAKMLAQLEKTAGRKVVMHESVDGSIIGGVVVRMGGKIMDGSVKSKLVKMREQMAGRGSEA